MTAKREKEINWNETVTFQQWVIRQIENKQTATEFFKAAVSFHGRERIESIWRDHLEKKGKAS